MGIKVDFGKMVVKNKVVLGLSSETAAQRNL